MVNLVINIDDVNFDREFLAKYDWLQMVQQKHHINMMQFCEMIPLELVEDNLFAEAQVSTEVEETVTDTDIEIEAKPNKKAHKEKIDAENEALKEAQQ